MQALLSHDCKYGLQNRGVEKAVHRDVDAATNEQAMVDLGRRLRAARKRAGITQAQAGERLELSSHSAIGQWERGHVLVETINLILAAQLYDESLDYLVFGMRGKLEQRIAALPEAIRQTIMDQVSQAVEGAEKMVRRNPKLFDGNVVPDGDPRLTQWSAKDKSKNAPMHSERKRRPSSK